MGIADILFLCVVQLSTDRAASFADVEGLSSLPFYHRLQLQSPRVRLSRKGFITRYQAAYRFWGAVGEPGLHATQQK